MLKHNSTLAGLVIVTTAMIYLLILSYLSRIYNRIKR